MPTYRYRCSDCGEEFEVWQSFQEDALQQHDACGGKLLKVLTPAGIVLKGSGFYKTDNRAKSRSASGSNGSSRDGDRPSKSDSAGKEGSSSSATDSSQSDSKSDSKSGSSKSDSQRSEPQKSSQGSETKRSNSGAGSKPST